MKTDYFRDAVEQKYRELSTSMYEVHSDFILNKINNSSDPDIQITNLGSIEKGKFYFMMYDLRGKSSNMEKFNPILAVDWIDDMNTRHLYGVSINFIPVAIRIVFFNTLLNHNLKTLRDNSTKDTGSQEALKGINFSDVYTLLRKIGFEWSLRKFDLTKIDKVMAVSTNILPEYITMSTWKITGVDDGKLLSIWQKKIAEQDERHRRLIAELINDYDKMSKDLNENILSLQQRETSMEDSIKLMRTLLK
jgi:hypothetical protein